MEDVSEIVAFLKEADALHLGQSPWRTYDDDSNLFQVYAALKELGGYRTVDLSGLLNGRIRPQVG